MSNLPGVPRWRFRSARPCIDPYRAGARIIFLREVDRLVPDAARRLADAVAHPFREFLSSSGYQLPGDVVSPSPSRGPPESGAVSDRALIRALRDTVGEPIPFLEPECTDADCPRCGARLAEARGQLFAAERKKVLEPLIENVRESLVEWAAPYNLHGDPWIRNHALGLLHLHLDGEPPEDLTQLRHWSDRLHVAGYWPAFLPGIAFEFPTVEPQRRRLFDGGGGSATDPREAAIEERYWKATGGAQVAAMKAAGWTVPPMTPYNPALDSRAAYLSGVERYMDHIEEQYSQGEWEPVPHFDALETYCSWLARWQVPRPGFPRGESYQQISDCPSKPGRQKRRPVTGTSFGNVKHQVKRLAEEIQLTRKSLIPG